MMYRREDIPEDLIGYFEEARSSHPTCKPVRLMAYLIQFLTRPGATVLDPFLGSGTTLCAAAQTGREGIGIDLSAEYLEIAKARVRHAEAAAHEKPEQLTLVEAAV